MESKLYGLNFAAFQASLRSKAHHKKREDTHARESAICFAIGENGCTYCSDSRWCDDETRASRYRRGHRCKWRGLRYALAQQLVRKRRAQVLIHAELQAFVHRVRGGFAAKRGAR